MGFQGEVAVKSLGEAAGQIRGATDAIESE